MKIRQILESVSVGGMGTGSIATAPAKAGKMIKREKGNLLAQEEQAVAEVGLGDYRKKAAMQKAQAGMGAMFAPDPEQRAKELATFKKRERGLNRLKARDEKARAADQQKQMAALVARLPELEAEYERMRAEYKSLGGSDWQYADREQNLTPGERKARDMEGPMNNIWRQIQAAKKHQGVAEGELTTYLVSVMDSATGEHWRIEVRVTSPEAARERAEAMGYKVLGVKEKQGMAEGPAFDKWADERVASQLHKLKKPHPQTWHDVDPKLGKQVDKMSQAEKVKKGLAHPDTLKKKELEEYGDTAKGQKMLTKVQKRAVDRMIKAADKGDAKTAGKNQDTANRAWDRMTDKDLEENKKGVRAVKHTTKAKSIEAPKPRNFVAKNAIQGGAGAHKDKKKAAKQGDVKHKAKELTYESQLWSALERKIGK